MNYLETVAKILAALPAEVVPAFGRMLSAILGGRPDAAAREARFAAEALAAKQAIRAGYKARAAKK